MAVGVAYNMAGASTIKHELVKHLNHLTPELQRRVLDFAQALAQSFPKGVAGKELLRFSGIMKDEDIQAMAQAIETGCEQVDVNEW